MRNSWTSTLVALLGAGTLYSSTILVKPPATDTGDKVRIEIRIKDSEGNPVVRNVTSARTPIGGNSSAENAQELADAINGLTGDFFKASVEDGELKISPGGDSLGGIEGEPTYYYDETLNTLLNLLFSQALIPDNAKGQEVGFGRLDWLTGTGLGGGQVSFSVGGVTATANTFAGEKSDQLFATLSQQLSSGGVPVNVGTGSLTAYSYDAFSVSHSDPGFALGFTAGTAAPEPSPALLFGLGLAFLCGGAGLRRVRCRASSVHATRLTEATGRRFEVTG
jgi:hypothetical protein